MNIMNLFHMCEIYLKQLLRNHYSAHKIIKIQEKKFRSILKYAASNSSFYSQLYRGIDLNSCSIEDLPIVTRKDILNHFDEMVTDPQLKKAELEVWLNNLDNQGSLYKDQFVPTKTSGTSGHKILIVYDQKSINAIHTSILTRLSIHWLTNIRCMLGGLIGKPLKIASVVMTSGTFPAVNSSKYTTFTHKLFVQHCVISSDQPLNSMINELNEFQPDILYSYAGVLEVLAQKQIEGQLQLKFKGTTAGVLSMSEILTPKARNLAKQAWNLIIDNTYAAAECLAIGRSCEQQNMHLMADICILEAVDENYNTVAPGKYGKKILITNLVNYAQPFIRYELHDVTGLSSSRCSCDSPFPVLLPILGRSSDNLLIKNKEGEIREIGSTKFIAELYKLEFLQDYQIHQIKINAVICYYVPIKLAQNNYKSLLIEAMEKAINSLEIQNEISYEVKEVKIIPRHKVSGKRQLVVSMEH
ncbi:MAG: hypothetical protein QM504_00675 [Pseudomonadota bacterium]